MQDTNVESENIKKLKSEIDVLKLKNQSMQNENVESGNLIQKMKQEKTGFEIMHRMILNR